MSIEEEKEFIQLGYGDLYSFDMRSLNFTTDELDTEHAKELVKLIVSYNSFRGDAVSQAIEEIAKLWPSTHQQISFRFGREYSPVLYIRYPMWLQPDKALSRRERYMRILASQDILEETEPTDLKCRDYETRAWWD